MSLAEIELSTGETSYAIHKETAAGKLRKIALMRMPTAEQLQGAADALPAGPAATPH